MTMTTNQDEIVKQLLELAETPEQVQFVLAKAYTTLLTKVEMYKRDLEISKKETTAAVSEWRMTHKILMDVTDRIIRQVNNG